MHIFVACSEYLLLLLRVAKFEIKVECDALPYPNKDVNEQFQSHWGILSLDYEDGQASSKLATPGH